MDKNRRPELGASQGYRIGRTRQRCINWRNDHRFVIGGYVKNGTDQVNLQSCNPLFLPLRLLNLTTYVCKAPMARLITPLSKAIPLSATLSVRVSRSQNSLQPLEFRRLVSIQVGFCRLPCPVPVAYHL